MSSYNKNGNIHTLTIKPGELVEVRCQEEGSNSNSKAAAPSVAIRNVVAEANLIEENSNGNAKGIGKGNVYEGGKKSRKNRTRKAQEGGKKKGLSGYMKFAAEVRPDILKENPEMRKDVTKVAKKIGEKWRALSDAEKARY